MLSTVAAPRSQSLPHSALELADTINHLSCLLEAQCQLEKSHYDNLGQLRQHIRSNPDLMREWYFAHIERLYEIASVLRQHISACLTHLESHGSPCPYHTDDLDRLVYLNIPYPHELDQPETTNQLTEDLKHASVLFVWAEQYGHTTYDLSFKRQRELATYHRRQKMSLPQPPTSTNYWSWLYFVCSLFLYCDGRENVIDPRPPSGVSHQEWYTAIESILSEHRQYELAVTSICLQQLRESNPDYFERVQHVVEGRVLAEHHLVLLAFLAHASIATFLERLSMIQQVFARSDNSGTPVLASISRLAIVDAEKSDVHEALLINIAPLSQASNEADKLPGLDPEFWRPPKRVSGVRSAPSSPFSLFGKLTKKSYRPRSFSEGEKPTETLPPELQLGQSAWEKITHVTDETSARRLSTLNPKARPFSFTFGSG